MKSFPEKSATFLFPSPAGRLEVMTTKPENNQAIVGIICHPDPTQKGSMNNKVVSTIARAFEALGLATVRFNFRGVGKSSGEFAATIGEKEDLRTILKWVHEVLPHYAIWLAGFSFGSYIAASIADQESVNYLISVAPPVEKYDFSALTHIQCPWLIIHGDQDEIAPCEPVRKFAGSAPLQIDFVEMHGVGHLFHGRLIELREILKKKLISAV